MPDLKDSKCLKCGQQSLTTSLKEVPGVLAWTGAAAKRCTSRHGNARCHPVLEHAVLVLGRGSDALPLSKQAKLMWHAAWNTPPRQVRADMGLSEKCVAAAYTRWRKVLKKWVEHKQAAIKVGRNYNEIEADEVVIRKKSLPRNKVQWYEYVGLKQRGDKESLILEKRPLEKTVAKRAKPVRPRNKGRAAPPPLKSEEWVAIAKKHVKEKTTPWPMLEKLMGWKSGETQLTMDADTVARIIPKKLCTGDSQASRQASRKEWTRGSGNRNGCVGLDQMMLRDKS